MPQHPLSEPSRVAWEPDFLVGHALIDAQHQGLLDQCNRLADLLQTEPRADVEPQFDQAVDRLKALVREHFEAEGALLAGRGLAVLDDHRAENEDFEYLADEIATTEHFDRLELQRFLALWCIGHVTASAGLLRAFGAGRDTAQ